MQPVASPLVQSLLASAAQQARAGHLAEAERLLRQLLSLTPRHAEALHLLGVIAYQTERRDLALDLIDKALAVNPKDPSIHSSRGNLLRQQGQLEEATGSYREALALMPDFAEAQNNLGNVLRALGRLDEAEVCYRRAIALRPDDAEARYHLAMLLLARGDFPAGWAMHEVRWQTPALRPARRDLPQQQWRGEPSSGKTLLIHAEQGFGDTLQFCRYVTLAAQRGLDVILQVQEPLVRLLGSLPGPTMAVPLGAALPAFDLHCPMMSLPLALGTTLETIPAAIPYLRPDQAKAASWRSHLCETPGLCVGVVWAGNPRAHNIAAAATDRRRSIAPTMLEPLAAVPGVRLISLQKNGPPPPASLALVEVMAEMADFADTAALVDALDLVVSVDTSVAHLAGALGKPVWLMDRFDPCWRWMLNRRDSPWYPTMRLYRQPAPNDWQSVVAEIARDLQSCVATGFIAPAGS